jgi:DNA invertase Pin-like site-specific DNA recombinase
MRLVEIRRVSTKEQAGENDEGFRRQADSNRSTAERVGATLIEPPIVITDVCRENFIDTPEWRRIRALIADPDVHIVVDMQDRIVGALEGLPILIECKRTGTLIYHSQGVTDPTTFAGQVLATFTALAAGNELHAIRHRAQGGKEAKRRLGIFPSADVALPTGIGYVREKGKAGRWTYNDSLQRVREVYRLVVEDGQRNWAEVGRRTGFTSASIRNILRNPIYRGLWVVDEKRLAGPTPINADGRRRDRKKVRRAPEDVIRHRVFRPKGTPPEPGDTREEALVDDATWDAVQDIVETKSRAFFKPREPKGATRFTYTGRLWCADCGAVIWSKTRGGPSGRRDHYVCQRTQRAGERCSLKYLRRDLVNTAIDRLITDALSHERFRAALIGEGLRSEREDFSGRIAERSKLLGKLRTQREKLLDLYLDPEGRWTKGTLDERAAKLDADIGRAERELGRLQQAQAETAQVNALDSFGEVMSALAEFDFWTPQERRTALARFFPRIEVSGRGVERVRVALPRVGRVGNVDVPLGDAALPLTLDVRMTWDELQLPVGTTDFGLPEREFYTRSDIKKLLGWSEWMLHDRLSKNILPEPTHRKWGKRAWTADEVRDVLARTQGGPAGLPRKPSYTSTEVAQALGVTWEQLRYLIKQGRVADCRTRGEQGRRAWTMAEVELVVGKFRNTSEVGTEPRE